MLINVTSSPFNFGNISVNVLLIIAIFLSRSFSVNKSIIDFVLLYVNFFVFFQENPPSSP